MAGWSCVGALDIFPPTKRLPGGFRLVQFESRYYYVDRPKGGGGGIGGVLRGDIEQIGWNNDAIVAWRTAMTGSERSGWMIIDVHRGEVEGPFSEEQFRPMIQADKRLIGIAVRPVAEVWTGS